MRLHGISSKAGRERQLTSVGEHYQLIELALAGEAKAIKTLLKTHIWTWEPIFADDVGKQLPTGKGALVE